jgi:hypothetical protein
LTTLLREKQTYSDAIIRVKTIFKSFYQIALSVTYDHTGFQNFWGSTPDLPIYGRNNRQDWGEDGRGERMERAEEKVHGEKGKGGRGRKCKLRDWV